MTDENPAEGCHSRDDIDSLKRLTSQLIEVISKLIEVVSDLNSNIYAMESGK